MQMRSMLSIAAVITAAAIPNLASAATMASATVDLNIRSGPGPQYPVTGAITRSRQAAIIGCIRGSLWCQVSYNGTQGWAYSKYMTVRVEGRTVPMADRLVALNIPSVTFSAPAAAPVVSTYAAAPPVSTYTTSRVVSTYSAPPAVTPYVPPPAVNTFAAAPAPVVSTVATTGVVTAPPAPVVDETVGLVGEPMAPPAAVQSYIVSHPVQPAYLNGEVVVGAGLPQNVALYPVPQYQYQYAYVNSVPVLVEPATRRVVYIYR